MYGLFIPKASKGCIVTDTQLSNTFSNLFYWDIQILVKTFH